VRERGGEERIDLPQLQSVQFGKGAFALCQSFAFESERERGVTRQICPRWSPSSLLEALWRVIGATIERRVSGLLSTGRTSW